MGRFRFIIVLVFIQVIIVSCVDDSKVMLRNGSENNSKNFVSKTNNDTAASNFRHTVKYDESSVRTESISANTADVEDKLNTQFKLILLCLVMMVLIIIVFVFVYIKLLRGLEARDHRMYEIEKKYNSLLKNVPRRENDDFNRRCDNVARINNVKSATNDNLQNRECRSNCSDYVIESSENSLGTISNGSIVTVSDDDISVKYGISYTGLIKESSDRSQYKIFGITGKAAKFKYVGDIEDLKANMRILDDICDYDGNYKSAIGFDVLKEGTCQLISNSKWEVIEKSKIKFK